MNVLICITTVIALKIQMVTLQMVFNFISKYRLLFIQVTLLTVMLDGISQCQYPSMLCFMFPYGHQHS